MVTQKQNNFKFNLNTLFKIVLINHNLLTGTIKCWIKKIEKT